MAQIGMGGFQAVGDINLLVTSGSPGDHIHIPENEFAIVQISFFSTSVTSGSLSISQTFAEDDVFGFGYYSKNIVFAGNDSEGDPRFTQNGTDTGIYLAGGWWYSLVMAGVGPGSSAQMTGVIFRNAPLVNP